jgi:flagellar hook-length control protein FliK
MIMQPVNVLPTFVSQDADLKAKELSGTSEGGSKDAEFSRLVDKHVDNENTAGIQKPASLPVTSVTANNDGVTEESGNSDTDLQNPRQESDSPKGNIDGIVSRSETNIADTTALDESEQFISMLYNSDHTLTNTNDKAKLSGHANEISNINSQQISSVDADEIDSILITDHKLKAFSKDESLALEQLKNSNTFTQQSSDQVLKDYQQLLQSKQDVTNSKNITVEQQKNGLLVNDKLANIQLQDSENSDLTAKITVENKKLLNERVDNGQFQLPVEPIKPIGKEVQGVDNAGLSGKETVVGINEEQNEKSVQLSNKSQAELSSSFVTKTSADLVNSETKVVKELSALIRNKTSVTEASKDEVKANSIIKNAVLDKINIDRAEDSAVNSDIIGKEKIINSQVKQGPLTSSQVKVTPQLQEQQKEHLISSDLGPSDDAVFESEYADLTNLSQDKTKESGVNVVGKVSDNIASRSVAELQNQAIQVNQAKQSNDAYFEHQSSEVLNNNVATDVAQIQKNNVQLQQETISIFKKDFADAVKDKVLIIINQKLQQFDITLDPPEFGNMQIRVNLQGEQAAVNFVVQNQQAKEALEQNMHKLKEMLAEQGVDVGGSSVEQQDKQQNNEEQSLAQGNTNSSLLTGLEEDNNVEHVLSTKLFDSSATGVDYYA